MRTNEALDALLTKVLNRRVAVENQLAEMAAGKRPLPDAEGCRALARALGDPTSSEATALGSAPAAACQHHYHHFGDQETRRCVNCGALEASAPPAGEPVQPTQEQAQAVAEFLHDKYACWQGVGMLDVLEVWKKLNEQMCSCAQPAEPAQPATQAGAGPAYDMAQIYDAFWRSGGQDGAWLKFAKQLQERSPPAYPAQPTEQPSQDANPPR